MSDGISAAWDEAVHYEQLCVKFNQKIRYVGPGPWPYNMDGKHYDLLKKLDQTTEKKLPPRAFRPLQKEYLYVGLILSSWGDYLYQSTEEEFIKRCMQLSNGELNPVRLRTIYNQLMSEAGI